MLVDMENKIEKLLYKFQRFDFSQKYKTQAKRPEFYFYCKWIILTVHEKTASTNQA